MGTVIGYNVYAQPADESTPRAKITNAPVPALTPQYLYAGLPSNTPYRFWGTAVDDAGLESDFSAMFTASTLEYPTGSELSPDDKAAVDAFVAASMAESGQPGVVLAITGPRGSYMQAYGNTAASGGRAVTIDDHFRIASTTKSFTATAFMRAVAAGLVTLDDTLDQHLSTSIPYADQITMRHLLTMRSGIQNYVALTRVAINFALRPTKAWTEAEILFAIESGSPSFTPGTAYEYNNGNFVLLGMVLKAVTGRYIRDIILQDLIGPLGLVETTWPANSSGVGISTVPEPAGGTATWNSDMIGCAGGMTSTVGDLIKWAQALRDHTRLDATVWAHWTDTDSAGSDFRGYPAPFREGTPTQFGYGLGLESTGTWLGHNGSWFGYDGQTGFDSVSGACMSILENKQTSTSSGPVNLAAYTTIFRRVAEYLYPGSMTTQPAYIQP